LHADPGLNVSGDPRTVVEAPPSLPEVVLLNGAGATLGAHAGRVADGAARAPPAYFQFQALQTGGLALYGIYRKRRHAPVPREQKGSFFSAQPQAVSGQMLAEIALQAAPPRRAGDARFRRRPAGALALKYRNRPLPAGG
jgi:hypothetical protein